ncbi:hypothetical protein Avbf_10546 [Armadillidium vulgare]|nr:hypothetical protein Avbf_10546 [Armadillidium vulgare]
MIGMNANSVERFMNLSLKKLNLPYVDLYLIHVPFGLKIRKLLAISRIPPAVNQVESHVRFQQNELAEFCRKNNIVLTAYAPLGSPGRENTGLQ